MPSAVMITRTTSTTPLQSTHSLSLSFSLKKNRLYSLYTPTMSLYPIIFSPSNQAHNRYDVARSSKFIIVLCVSPLSCSAAKVAKPFGTGEEEECVRFVACMELHSTGLVVGTCAAYTAYTQGHNNSKDSLVVVVVVVV